MADASHYTYRVTWSEPDGEFVGTVAEFPSLSWLAETQAEALDGVIGVVRDVLEDMALTGEQPPVPIADRPYSGKFMVRTSPQVHRALATEAEEQGVSLNLLVNQKLSAPAVGRTAADTNPGVRKERQCWIPTTVLGCAGLSSDPSYAACALRPTNGRAREGHASRDSA